MTAPFRCSAASEADGEPLAGTAPTEPVLLALEQAGTWGRQAVAESRLPDSVRAGLGALDGVRVQLIRRHGRAVEAGVRLLVARRGDPAWAVESVLLDRAEDLLDLPLDGLSAARGLGLPAYDGPLWLVCTNGRRDVCCSERGRPVAAALAAQWPDATWETTHLGGHRFAATLLALPSGVALGRLAPESALRATAELHAGRLPLDLVRGTAGLPAAAQAAELRLRAELGASALGAVRVVSVDGHDVLLESAGRRWRVLVTEVTGEPIRQSCGVGPVKPATSWLAGTPRPA